MIVTRPPRLSLAAVCCLLAFVCEGGLLARPRAPSDGEENIQAATPDAAWTVAASKRIRVIINSDAANESDDQVVIAHALLSPAFEIRGLIAAHFRPHSASPVSTVEVSMEASYREIHGLLNVMDIHGCVPVLRGAAGPMTSADEIRDSEGETWIVQEALRDDSRPLFVVFLGPLTDLAAAYRKEPRIAQHLTAVWIGGGVYPNGGPEYNQDGDRVAARLVMESDIPVWQIPRPVYRLARFGMAEVADKVGNQGELGGFLFARIKRFVSQFPPLTEFFQFSDEPAVAVLLQPPWSGGFEEVEAPSITEHGYYVYDRKNRPIRVYRSYDHRAALEDLFAKLAAFSRGEIHPACEGRTEK